MDQFGARTGPEQVLDGFAVLADDQIGGVAIEAGKAARYFMAELIADRDGIAARESAFEPDHADGQQRTARLEGAHGTVIDGDAARQIERAHDPAFSRGAG